MDLPQFTIMPTGLDDWDRIWKRREGDPPQIHAPRLRRRSARHMRAPFVQLRPFPWQPKRNAFSSEGADLGVPARVFPQWLRCTGCDMLGLVSQFSYVNTHPYRTDLARFEHPKCPGRSGEGKAHPPGRAGTVPARLRGGAPGRVPVRPVGPPWPPLREGRVPDPEDDRPDRGQGRVGDDPLRVLWRAAADERGPGRRRAPRSCRGAVAVTPTWTRSSRRAAARRRS